jgi:hypothetical protein
VSTLAPTSSAVAKAMETPTSDEPQQGPVAPEVTDFKARIRAMEDAIAAMGNMLERVTLPTPSLPHLPSNAHEEERVRSHSHGTFEPQAPEIPVRNKRFAPVLCVELYRLTDLHAVLRARTSGTLTSIANQLRPRMDDALFSGDPALSVLLFLSQLTMVADQSSLSEAELLWIVEDFVRPPVKGAFRAQRPTTWPIAVHLLLTTYAAESLQDQSLRKINNIAQFPSEPVRAFGLRLQLEATALGPLLSVDEIKTWLAIGLSDPVRSHFAAYQPANELDDHTPLSILITRAELLEKGIRTNVHGASRYAGRSSPRPSPIMALSDPHIDYPGSFLDDEESAVFAIDSTDKKPSSESWVCFVCYKRGHDWIECQLLSHVSSTEKEAVLLRRRQYVEERRGKRMPRIPSFESLWPDRTPVGVFCFLRRVRRTLFFGESFRPCRFISCPRIRGYQAYVGKCFTTAAGAQPPLTLNRRHQCRWQRPASSCQMAVTSCHSHINPRVVAQSHVIPL